MNDTDAPVVPIWTLSTSEATTLVPAVADQGTLTPERLTELRSALATFSSAPLVTLEAHPLPAKRDRSAGLPLDAVSPLAQGTVAPGGVECEERAGRRAGRGVR